MGAFQTIWLDYTFCPIQKKETSHDGRVSGTMQVKKVGSKGVKAFPVLLSWDSEPNKTHESQNHAHTLAMLEPNPRPN